MEDEFKKILLFNQSRDRINSLKDDIKDLLAKIKKKQKLLQENLDLYISRDGENHTHFGIDSFSFQTKIIELEYQNLYKINAFIRNRIYGSYYKLYNDIYKFLRSYHKEDCSLLFSKVRKKDDYPVYQDLDSFKVYEQSHISNIHADIVLFLIKIWDIIKNNNLEIDDEKKKVSSGLNLDNYLGFNCFVNNNLKNKLSFYINVLAKYHHYHITNLDNLLLKITLMCKLLDRDIKMSICLDSRESSELNEKVLLSNILEGRDQCPINENENDLDVTQDNN